MLDLTAYPTHDLLKSKDAARVIDTTEGTLAVWRCTGRHPLKYIRIGRSIRYRVGDLLEFIQRYTRDPAGREAA
jgi:hypothetical protein